jgi:hypothetical protein
MEQLALIRSPAWYTCLLQDNSITILTCRGVHIAKWPAAPCEHEARRSPAIDLHCAVAIGLFGFSWVGVRLDSMTVTGMETPSSVKMRVIPRTRPTTPIVMLTSRGCTGFLPLWPPFQSVTRLKPEAVLARADLSSHTNIYQNKLYLHRYKTSICQNTLMRTGSPS